MLSVTGAIVFSLLSLTGSSYYTGDNVVFHSRFIQTSTSATSLAISSRPCPRFLSNFLTRSTRLSYLAYQSQMIPQPPMLLIGPSLGSSSVPCKRGKSNISRCFLISCLASFRDILGLYENNSVNLMPYLFSDDYFVVSY